MSSRWIEDLFIDRANIMLEIFDDRWEVGREEASAISILLNRLGLSKESRILEVGCGNGRVLIHLSKLGYRNLVGIDISPTFIEDAKRKAAKYGTTNVEFVVGDALKLDEHFREGEFDVAMFVWTSVLGYYLDERVDMEILAKVRGVVGHGGYLLIMKMANRDFLIKPSEYCEDGHYSEHGRYVILKRSEFDPRTSIYRSRWRIYIKRWNGDLIQVDEVEYANRVYSLHELIKLAEGTGWRCVGAYSDIKTLEKFRSGSKTLNVIFKAV